MKEKGLTFPTRPSATIIPLDAKTERRPLGLAPVLDDDDRAPDRNGDTPGYLEAKRLIAEAVASLPEAARNQPATIADVFEGLELPLAIEMDAAAAIRRASENCAPRSPSLRARIAMRSPSCGSPLRKRAAKFASLKHFWNPPAP
jgi:hypothetical protein